MVAAKAIVLAYHSHNVSGRDYASNDHVAFASDLETLTRAGVRIVPLRELAQALEAGRLGEGGAVAALTFDDGPRFDAEDFTHPVHGEQRGFLNIMRDFRERRGSGAQPGLHATSFVIASREARQAMARAPECGYTFLDDWLTDAWWQPAVATGLIEIGNHSWDHVHGALEATCISRNDRNDFSLVDNYEDADREIRRAGEFIRARTGAPCEMFAFPFGHANAYLLEDYLPGKAAEHGMVAAVGTGGRAVRDDDSVWNIPRVVCGHDWKSPAELLDLLHRGQTT